MKVKVKLIEEMLGTASANPEIHKEFIASKSADAALVAGALGTERGTSKNRRST